MVEWLLPLAGFVAGAVLAWIATAGRASARTAGAEAREGELRRQLQAVAGEAKALAERLTEAEKSKTAAETRAAETEKNLAAQKAVLDEARAKLSETFQALAAEALAGNSQRFLNLAEAQFKALQNETTGALAGLVQPLNDALTTYRKDTNKELGSLGNELQRLAQTHAALQTETTRLANALRSPQVRGRWGEMTLRRTAELAGLSVHCDFIEQQTATGGDGRLRPDMIIKLPAGREIVVDSKVPLDGFLDAMEAASDPAREAALVRYTQQVNRHVINLSSKEYWDQFPAAPEFVVLFIPTDSFLAAAAERDPALLQNALSRKVIFATPSTFIALLLAVAYGWRQEKLAENAQRVKELGEELYDRMAVLVDHFGKLGGALGRAVEAYNSAVGSWESRVLPSARKFKELGAGGKKDIDELPAIEQGVRLPSAPDLFDGLE